MKIKNILLIVFVLMGTSLFAQVVEHKGSTYTIKDKSILKDGNDVTSTLNDEEKAIILTKHQEKLEKEKMAKEHEKMLKKAQKNAKKVEKELKKAEKELKEKEKAQKQYQKASDKLEDAQTKFQRLKRKGKLSPNDEADWLDKIDKLEDDVKKYRKKLRNS